MMYVLLFFWTIGLACFCCFLITCTVKNVSKCKSGHYIVILDMQFIEGGIKKESGSNDEGSDNRNESETNGTNVNGLDSLHLAEQV